MATYRVTSTADTVNANDGVLTLREAVIAANAQSNSDTITFQLSGRRNTINLNSVLEISNSVSIQGLGTNALTVSGRSAFDTFAVSKGTVTFERLTISNGNDNIDITGNNANVTVRTVVLTGAADDGFDLSGNSNTVILDNVISKNNEETGIEIDGQTNRLTINNGELSNNRSADGALFLDAEGTRNTVVVTGTRISSNLDDGVDIDSSNNTLSFTRVTFGSNIDDGMSIDGNTNRITVSQSSFTGNTDKGIELKGADNNLSVTNTRFTSNRGGNIENLGRNNGITAPGITVQGASVQAATYNFGESSIESSIGKIDVPVLGLNRLSQFTENPLDKAIIPFAVDA
jgi:CSLREA domain-containing protein